MTAEASSSSGVGKLYWLLSTLACLGLGAIALYSSGVGLVEPKFHRAAGFALALVAGIAASRVRRQARRQEQGRAEAAVESAYLALDLALLVAGLWSIWSFYSVQSQMETALYDVTISDAWPALAGLVVFLELCRRLWGWGLFAVGAFGVLYLLYGQDLPGLLAHAGFSLTEVAEALWYNTNKGVFGSITNIVLSTVFIFIVFGVLLEGTGAGDTLLKFAFLTTRRTRGGPAHAAILASSMFGTMSGSTVANIVGTGTFTIPMIKKRGFSPTFAAGIEATASSGGQIMPPIMGAAALVMADLTGVGYLNIIVAAFFPALFYYFSLFSAVTVEARRQGIEVQPISVDDRITRVDAINSVLFLGPILTIIGSLVAGYSTSAAGFYAVIVLLVLSVINPDVRADPLRIWRSFLKGAQSGATLLIAIAAIGILVGSLDSTGLGLKLANVIADIRGDSLFSALLVAMIGALVLGMGMPTLPAYLIIILVMGPAIQQLGVSMLTAHMFVFYYGVASSLTPPVAIAAYAAAPIAGANPLMTAFMSFRLGMAKFIIPFVFAFYPTILIIEEFSMLPFLWIVARTCFCIWLFSSALSGYDRRKLTLPEIVLRLAAAFTMLVPDPMIHLPAILTGLAPDRLGYTCNPNRWSALMSKRPNFLFIISDQHRADHLGCGGNTVVRTPNIDSIAAKGTMWDRFYVANPICMPNRASIMTGRMCSAHGARHNGIPLSKDHTTFVELLRDAGYRTGLIGKSHLQSFTGLPATNQFEPAEGLHTPSPHLRDAIKNNRHSAEYDLEVIPKWDRPLADRIDGDFYGFEDVEVAADHADQASGDYLLWAREQRPDFDELVGPNNALSDNRIDAPQAWRTAVPRRAILDDMGRRPQRKPG